MKRVNAIVKAVGKISEIFTRKADRILRRVDTAIACAKDNADETREAAYDLMNSLGDASSKEDSGKLQDILNNYIAKMEEAERWDGVVRHLEKLKQDLNEEVSVEEGE